MGKIYAKQVMRGRRTIDKVPKMWYDATITAFKGYVADGTITEEQYKEYTGLDYEAGHKEA